MKVKDVVVREIGSFGRLDCIVREADVLRRIRAIFDAGTTDASIIVGNGDDGAVLALADQTVIATDMAVEDIHFRRQWSTAEQIGRKITAANLADICAMGGWPTHLVVSVAFPSDFLGSLEDLASGIALEARKVGARVVGGDLSQGNHLVISITALGKTKRAIRRSSAKVGDSVVVSHLPGLSAAGLYLLEKRSDDEGIEAKTAIAQHCAPEIDYERYRDSCEFLHSATDISDGLIIDLSHIASSSSVAIDIKSEAIQNDQQFEVLIKATSSKERALEFVLTGGEDHVLLGTTSSPEKCRGFLEIGRVIPGQGVFVDGELRDNESGYQHNW